MTARGVGSLALLGLCCGGLLGCPQDGKSSAGDAGRSPNATLRPSPVSSAPLLKPGPIADASVTDGPVGIPADSSGRLIRRDAGAPPPPKPIAAGDKLPADRIPTRELDGVTMTAVWQWADVPAPPAGHEVSSAGINAAKKAMRHAWQIELAHLGRMRIVFDSPSFPLTKFTELRARYDLLGHAMVWPDGATYRVIPPGALRALLDERRIDVGQLVAGQRGAGAQGGSRFGFPTHTDQLSTPWGKLALEQARTVNVGEGGPLLCRTLVELVGALPSSPVCDVGKVPVHAEYTWKDGSKITFDVSTLLIRKDFPGSLFATPPTRAAFTETGLPPDATGVFLSRDDLAAFRSAEVPNKPEPRSDPESVGAPGEGLVAENKTDVLRYVVVDGVPVAWVPAHGRQYLIGTKRGRYVVQWRSFLGSFIGEPRTVMFPARIALGEPADGGTIGAGGSAPQ